MIRKIAITLLACLLVTGSAFSMGGGSGHGGGPQKKKWIGPYLYSWSELAQWYTVVIDGQGHTFNTNEENELILDLQQFGLSEGYHDIQLTPCNVNGEAPPINFILDVKLINAVSAVWEIILLQEQLEEPGYKESFSADLRVVVFKR